MIPVKACGCGRTYDAAAWRALPLCGYQDVEPDRAELRHCVCGSTIAVLVPSATLLHDLAHLAAVEASHADDEDDRAHLTELAAAVDAEAWTMTLAALTAA